MFRNQMIRFAILLLLPSALAAASQGSREYRYGQDVTHVIRKRQMNQPPVVSSIPINGTIPLRMEIRDLEKNQAQWNLYILALSWMQYMNQTDPYSWYGLAGIHGAPFTDYGGVTALPGHETDGYCAHVSNLFPTWHRPYLALFEQTMYGIIQAIASMYPDDRRETFEQAAVTFRVPYWDWAAKPPNGDGVLPQSISGSPTVDADGPNGIQNIANPLFSYTFKPLNASAFTDSPFMYWTETKRRPTPYNGINATSNNSFVARTFDIYLSSYQQRLYNLFANYDNYSTWSNEAWEPADNNGTFDSIESLHDTIHMACGGNYGHMAIIAYSSFDPLFFLLHAMVDRIFAMWQIIHNDSYVGPMANEIPTRTIELGTIQDSQTNLTPFFYNESSFWNSDLVRDHQVFGYSYAEVVNGNRSEVITAINNLYTNYSPSRMFAKLERNPSDELSDRKNDQKHVFSGASGIKDTSCDDGHSSTMPPVELIIKNGSYREWVANIRVDKHAMNASFLIHLFLGHIPQDASSWDFAHNLVGTMGIFAGNHTRPTRPSQRIAATVPLTSALVALVSSGDLHSLDPSDVEPFLRQYLGFRVALNDGSAVEPDGVDGLSISIVSSEVKAPQSDKELASWGDIASHFDVYQSL